MHKIRQNTKSGNKRGSADKHSTRKCKYILTELDTTLRLNRTRTITETDKNLLTRRKKSYQKTKATIELTLEIS